MIGKITGILDYKAADHVLIDVRGVGYVVYVTDRVLAGLPGAGEPVALYTDLLVREDLLQLFGFTTLAEKEWHRLLMSVQGIGAKASMAILGTLGADGVSRRKRRRYRARRRRARRGWKDRIWSSELSWAHCSDAPGRTKIPVFTNLMPCWAPVSCPHHQRQGQRRDEQP